MALVEGQAFPGGWRVETLSHTSLVLTRPAGSPWLVLRRAGFVVIPLVLAAALLAGTWEVDAGLKLVAWPVAGLLAVVAVLGVLAAVRTAAGRRVGQRLEVDSRKKELTGVPLAHGQLLDFRPRLHTARWAEVQQVLVSVHPGGSTGPGLVAVSVTLASGGRLQGPEVACQDPDLDEASRALTPVAEALAERLGVPLSRTP